MMNDAGLNLNASAYVFCIFPETRIQAQHL